MQKHAVVLVLIGKDRTWNTFARQRSNKQQNITARQQPRWHIVRSKSMYSRRLGWVGCSVQWRSQKISDLRGAVYRRRDRGVKGGERVSPSHRRRDLGRGPFTLPIIFFFIFFAFTMTDFGGKWERNRDDWSPRKPVSVPTAPILQNDHALVYSTLPFRCL